MQDTGGFFVAVLERKKKEGSVKRAAEEVEGVDGVKEPVGKKPRLDVDEVPAVEKTSTADGEEAAGEKDKEPSPPAADGSFKEMPYTYLAPDEPLVEAAMYVPLSPPPSLQSSEHAATAIAHIRSTALSASSTRTASRPTLASARTGTRSSRSSPTS